MKRLLPVVMGFALLLLSSTEGWSLPPCPGSPTDNWDTRRNWTNCSGTFNFALGNKYVGEWKDGERTGWGTLTFANGVKYVGGFRNGRWHGQGALIDMTSGGRVLQEGIYNYGSFLYAKKISPTVTAKKSPTEEWSADFQKGLDAYNKKDYATALREWKPLAEQGYASAQNNLGQMYRRGQGVSQNHKTAMKWYRLAAEQGHVFAQNNLGQIYYEGRGVPQNHKTAVKWYTLAAEQGDAPAQFNLGQIYYEGRGVPQDYKTAVKWYRLAAEQGDAPAQYNLGNQYYRGQGVIQDDVYAHMWWNIAASQQGHKNAIKNRDIVANQMTRSQLAKAQQLARNFVPKKSDPVVVAKKSPEPQVKKKPKPSGTSGSGFFISKLGHVITNQHVVSDCRKVTIGDNSKKQVTATVMETDRRNDLALLRISNMQMASVETKSLIQKLGIKVVPLATDGLMRSEDVELGEDVLVAGYPYGEVFSDDIKVNKGIVSGLRGMGDESGQFQIDAAVQPGNSGGPIYDENGNIVGVVVSQLNKMKFAKATGSIPENVNFGIKASTVRQFLNASGLPTKWSKRSKSMSTRELAKIAKSQTVMVVCHR